MHVRISRVNTERIKIEFGKFFLKKKSMYESYLHFHDACNNGAYNLNIYNIYNSDKKDEVTESKLTINM